MELLGWRPHPLSVLTPTRISGFTPTRELFSRIRKMPVLLISNF